MAASMQCGHIRAESASHAPQTATGQAITCHLDSARETGAGGHPLPSPASGAHGGWWERAFPGTLDQPSLVRAEVGRLLAGRPIADDVVLLMSDSLNLVNCSDCLF